VQFAVGFKIQGKTGHVVVDAEDALIAALKVKMQRPEALIAYVRQQNKRGDTRHPMRRLGSENAQCGHADHVPPCDLAQRHCLLIAVASHKSRTNWQSRGRERQP
jgi:hypothetical protein